MASPAEELLRRSADAYGGYVRAVAGLASEYARGLRSVARTRIPTPERAVPPQPPPAEEPASAPAARTELAAMVLEAPLGGVALGAFVVENAFERSVEAGVVASPLSGPSGDVEPAISFEPASLTLAPGEQAVVRAALAVDERMEAGLEYRGELSVPTLPGTRIPIVVRRTLEP